MARAIAWFVCTSRPSLAWLVDTCGAGVLLSAFPGLIARDLLQRRLGGGRRRAACGALTLGLVAIITATYHAGYEELRTVRGVIQPEIGNIVISVPVIASANPAGSILAHVSMHLAAVTHAYESGERLPPRVLVDGSK